MTDLITNVIRDKDGKLVAVYETTSGRGTMPDEIAIKFGGLTPAELAERKANPNYAGNVIPLSPLYTQESIRSVDPSSYYKSEIEQGLPARNTASYNQKLEAIKKEATQRRLEEQNRIESITRSRDSAIVRANTQKKKLHMMRYWKDLKRYAYKMNTHLTTIYFLT